ncbi:MAG: pyruvate ferredoxin oxidoreductase, partial [Dehalococcoidia bacterium]|nr:pyruvate ferredoxin oxidoreductase [Dehalococcoidia bacterium]
MRKKGLIDAVFGDIGCNALLYFLDVTDTSLAMGASEGMRQGLTLSRPKKASRSLAIVGDSTECHTGMAATRNAVYRNIPGVKVILDNSYTAMTGGQPSPTSPVNLAGEKMRFNLPASLEAHGARVKVVAAYDRKAIHEALVSALAEAKSGVFTTIVVQDGQCLRQSAPSTQRVVADPELCKKCDLCLICSGIEKGPDGIPVINQLCSGCGGHTPSCVQMCPFGALKAVDITELDRPTAPQFPTPPTEVVLPEMSASSLPDRLSLAIRGVGGQGNIFFGRILTGLAFLAGYGQSNI